MAEIGKLIARALHAVENETALADVRKDVLKLCERFPLYAARLEACEKALARA
jgi:glycine/serine hydroxymethyltransferase